jgi:hypothetical protein
LCNKHKGLSQGDDYEFKFNSYSSLKEANGAVYDFMVMFYNDNNFNIEELNEKDLLYNSIQIINPKNLKFQLFKIDLVLKELNEKLFITNDEFSLLNEIQHLIISNKKGEVDNVEFNESIIFLYTENEKKLLGMKIAPVVMGIALASGDYWLNRPFNDSVPVTLWNDAAGALVGGAISAATQYLDSGDVDLYKMGRAALVTGLSASFGLIGKVSKGMSRFFK